jgi:hypothetical protein
MAIYKKAFTFVGTSFADLVKNGVLMIIPIYAKVSFNKSCPLKD